MPRSLWTGALSFGLVNVPVALFSAARDLDLHFHQIHEKDATPIEMQRWCSKEDREVPYEELARSFEFDDGKTVVVTDDELEGLEPRRTRTIEIEQFVDLSDVDPIYFDHPYLLAPAADNEGALRAYRLLVEVMSRTDRAALGRFVMRAKEYLAIVRVRDGVLTLSTMRFADEVRPTKDVDGAGGRKPAKAQVSGAVKLIDAMTVEWDPSQYDDRYRQRLADLVKRKRKGQTIKAPSTEKEPSPVPDLMAALRESLEQAQAGSSGNGGGKRSPSRDGRKASADRSELDDLSRDELYERAQEQDIPGRSSMSKRELVKALSE
jgi:DNA end-binding protein Ku